MAELEADLIAAAQFIGNIRSHARTQIRRAAACLLEQENGNSWKLVYQSRIDYPREIWPYLKIYSDSEDCERISIHTPHAQQRTLSLLIVALIRIGPGETETIEDKMDQTSVAIESLMNETELRTKLNYITMLDLISSRMDVILLTDESVSHAELTMSYRVQYHTFEGMPDGFI